MARKGEAESDYLAAQASLRLARSSFERQAQLRAERISSEREFLAARQELEAAQIRTSAAEDKLARLGAAPAELARLERAGRPSGRGALLVRAPADGIVLERHAVPGVVVMGGLVTSTLLTLLVLPVLYCVFAERVPSRRRSAVR